jgi:hypothetical protein
LRGDERKLDRQIVEYICEIESRRLYAELGYANVIDWLVKDLGYSESSAYRRMMAARAIRAVPEAAEKIEDGRLNLVTLAKVQSAIRSEEKRTGERVSLETRSTIIAQTENKTLRELKSHSNFGASLGEIVAVLAREYLDRNDPLRREMKPRSMRKKLPITSLVKTSEKPHEKTSEESATHPFEKHIADVSEGSSQGGTSVVFGPETRMRGGARRASIAPSTRNFVRRRAGDACEYQGPDGHRCGSRFQTQTDHVIPLAIGGTNDVTNLRLLCRTHSTPKQARKLSVGRR